MSVLREAGHIAENNTVVLTILTLRHKQCLHLMYAEEVQVSSGTQVQPQIISDLDYLPDYSSVSYDFIGNYQFSVHSILINFTSSLHTLSLSNIPSTVQNGNLTK